MKMQQRQFRIGELAKQIGVERFVIRFWEKEFNLKPTRSEGGQRFYQEADLQKFKLIKQLLHQEKFTIAGAKRYLHDHQQAASAQIIGSQKTTLPDHDEPAHPLSHEFMTKLYTLKKQLEILQKLL